MLRYCLFLVLVSALCVKSDVCSFSGVFTNNAGCATPSQVQTCFNAIPFNETVRSLTITTMRQLITLYSFTDIAQNSGEPYNVQVDLSGGLDTIAAKAYTSDYAFHADLMQLFNQLYDGHTLYYTPAGYQKFVTYRPFLLSSVSYNGVQAVVVYDTTFSADTYSHLSSSTVNITNYVGKQVLRINGVDALTYIKNFADTIGTYKDPAVRFNAAINSNPGWFAYVPQAALPLPSDTEVYDFGTENVTVNLYTVIAGANTDIKQIQTENQFSSTAKRSESEPAPRYHMAEGPIDKYIKPRLEAVKQDKPSANMKRATPYFNILSITDTQDTAYGTTTEGNCAVFKLTTFAPSVTDTVAYPNPWDNYREVLEYGFADAKSKGIKNLIVDVVGNGGGYVGLSYATLRSLVKSYNTTGVYQPYDYRESATSSSLVNIGFLDTDYFKSGTETLYTDRSFNDPIARKRGGTTSNYSQLVSMAVPLPNETPNFWMDNSGYYFDKIIVLTDGTCGSACAYFSTKLKQDTKAWIVSAGGVMGEDMDIASFAGGNVYDWDSYVSYINYYLSQTKQTMSNQPVQLPTSAATRFNFNEVYFYNTSVPREYIRVVADEHLNNWFFNYPDLIYPDVVPLFADFPAGWPAGNTGGSTSTGSGSTDSGSSTTASSSSTTSDSSASKLTGIVALFAVVIALLF